MYRIYISTMFPELTKAMLNAINEFEIRDTPDIEVEVIERRFEDILNVRKVDCMVSAANSFGLMDGGVDYAITSFFGRQLMNRVQKRIQKEYHGEQPVGTAFSINTTMPSCPWLIHAPTMRIPLIIKDTDAVYTSTWAALLAMEHSDDISSIIFPCMGAGCGEVSPDSVARQMMLAIRNFALPVKEISWVNANLRQRHVRHAVGGTKYTNFKDN